MGFYRIIDEKAIKFVREGEKTPGDVSPGAQPDIMRENHASKPHNATTILSQFHKRVKHYPRLGAAGRKERPWFLPVD
ncbi:MAG: hypothetical protein JRE61_12650 [Deltaproteobacteria bacterium]|nr:hypothetical protein [Deltaproteobacteria bacterium]